MEQNYPNPFNSSTSIKFSIPDFEFISLKVYNILGQEIATLVDQQEIDEWTQEVVFDATNFASGLYFYRLTARGTDDQGQLQMYQSVKKMMLIK